MPGYDSGCVFQVLTTGQANVSHGLLADGEKEPWLMDCPHDGGGAHSSRPHPTQNTRTPSRTKINASKLTTMETWGRRETVGKKHPFKKK